MRALLLCLLLVGCEKGGTDKIALRFHPPAGAVYHHTLEQHTRIELPSSAGSPGGVAGMLAGLGTQELRLRMFSTQTVKGPAAGGGTEIEIVVDSATMDMPGMTAADVAGELARLRGTRNVAVFDDRSKLVRTEFTGLQGAPPQLANQMASVLQGMTYEFPEHPVGRGDSWNASIKLPIEQFGGTDASKAGAAETKLTIRDIRVSGADTTVTFDIKTTFPEGPIQLAVAGQKGEMRLSGDLTGYQEFSISRGTIVDASIKGSSTIHMSVASLGLRDMTVTTQTESSVHLGSAP